MAPSVYLGNMMRLPAFMKIGEIIMLIIAITMVQASNHVSIYSSIHFMALVYGIVVGYLIVYLILIACYLIGETGTQRSKFELLLNVVGFILFFSVSIKMFVIGADLRSSNATQTIVVGVFALLISACQLLDAFFNFRSGDN